MTFRISKAKILNFSAEFLKILTILHLAHYSYQKIKNPNNPVFIDIAFSTVQLVISSVKLIINKVLNKISFNKILNKIKKLLYLNILNKFKKLMKVFNTCVWQLNCHDSLKAVSIQLTYV